MTYNDIEATYPSGRVIKKKGIFVMMPTEGFSDGVPAIIGYSDVCVLSVRSVVMSNGVRVYAGPAEFTEVKE